MTKEKCQVISKGTKECGCIATHKIDNGTSFIFNACKTHVSSYRITNQLLKDHRGYTKNVFKITEIKGSVFNEISPKGEK